MGLEKNMNEQMFKDELIKIGCEESHINESLELYKKLKEDYTNLSLEEWIKYVKYAHEKNKNNPDGFISVD